MEDWIAVMPLEMVLRLLVIVPSVVVIDANDACIADSDAASLLGTVVVEVNVWTPTVVVEVVVVVRVTVMTLTAEPVPTYMKVVVAEPVPPGPP